MLALLFLALALIGVVLPGLPTVPFLLAAAWAASHGWPRLEAWMLRHPRWGPPIRAWREHGAISRRAKVIACTMMAGSVVVMWLLGAPTWGKIGMPVVLLGVGVWMWRRPER